MVIAFVGVATFNKSGTGATSILQAVIFSKPEAPVEERHTGSFLLLLRFLRSCAWCGFTCSRLSDSGGDLQDTPAHKGFSPHSSREGFVEEPFCVRLSGAEGGKPIATLALSMGVFDPIQPPTPIRGVYTEVFAQKA
jgi:hypothetical protein